MEYQEKDWWKLIERFRVHALTDSLHSYLSCLEFQIRGFLEEASFTQVAHYTAFWQLKSLVVGDEALIQQINKIKRGISYDSLKDVADCLPAFGEALYYEVLNQPLSLDENHSVLSFGEYYFGSMGYSMVDYNEKLQASVDDIKKSVLGAEYDQYYG